MNYISTRGSSPPVGSVEALLQGIAPDGGLYIPACFPAPPPVESWLSLSFNETLQSLFSLFFDDLPEPIRRAAADAVTARFPAEPTPLRKVGKGYVLELFHGPTRAFKDVALSALPVLLQGAARMSGKAKIAVLTATSGDTGSAAMYGFSCVDGTEVLVFYPQYGISDIQRRQMVCCPGKNVHACAVDGTFDDAQRVVKAIFTDEKIRQAAAAQGLTLSSANSINIGRLIPQMAYYIDAFRTLNRAGFQTLDVIVPTGNFGNILAAHYARRLGIPLRGLRAVSNRNCAVSEWVSSGVYNAKRPFAVTNSPSMDILVSSNTERFLSEIASPERVRALMNGLRLNGAFTLSETERQHLQNAFSSARVDELETEKTMAEVWTQEKYLLDPHTAIAYRALNPDSSVPQVVAATASPWKFPSTVERALSGVTVENDFDALRKVAEKTASVPDPVLSALENAPLLHTLSCSREDAVSAVRACFDF